jgi:hypothetical protein
VVGCVHKLFQKWQPKQTLAAEDNRFVMAEQRAIPPLRLLDLPHELLEKVVALVRPEEWSSFASASKTAKAGAQGAVGAIVAAEVSRRLVCRMKMVNRLFVRCPALEITVPTSVTSIFPVRLCSCDPCAPPARRPHICCVPSLARAPPRPRSPPAVRAQSAFKGCSRLTSVAIPPSVTSIKEVRLRSARPAHRPHTAHASAAWPPSHEQHHRARARRPLCVRSTPSKTAQA